MGSTPRRRFEIGDKVWVRMEVRPDVDAAISYGPGLYRVAFMDGTEEVEWFFADENDMRPAVGLYPEEKAAIEAIVRRTSKRRRR